MIAGVGTDLVEIEAFAAQLADRASIFAQGTFTAQERRTAENRPGQNPARHLAARFAAKEAFIKAWSSARRGRAPALSEVDFRQIEVVCDPYKRPALRLHGDVAAAVAELGHSEIHVSLSHDGPMAIAFVILETVQGQDSEEKR